MRSFIKIIDTNNKEHYLNVSYIIQFTPTSEGYAGNTIIMTTNGSIQTTTTPQEVWDMINLEK